MTSQNFKFAIALAMLIATGCNSAPNSRTAAIQSVSDVGLQNNLYQSLKPEHPDTGIPISAQQFDTGPLTNFNFDNPENFTRLTLDQCIENGLRNSQVVRELGGTILRSPEAMLTENDPAIAYTNPVLGEEAALSEFDAIFRNQFGYQGIERAFNSTFIGDLGILDQNLATNITSLAKRSATGAEYRLTQELLFDQNNTPANRFSNDKSYDLVLGGEIRQPLLQGRGVTFNRIAGRGNIPGVNTGLLIARTNTDISLADFELGIRNLVSDIENAYWDLYFAYRDLEAKIEARNGAHKIWESLKNQDKRAAEILQAEEQYYLFASRVEDAIYGQLNDGTRTNNGSLSGTFRGNSGVRTAERRLRLLAGYPVNENVLIVPQDMPIEAQVVFDWNQVKTDALTQRIELRKQRWVLKRVQLEYLANKNYLMPRLDLVGKYRARGFGNDLFGNDAFDPSIPPGVSPQDNSDATASFWNGDFHEWEVGLDLNIPIGYRRELGAVRNSELQFMRETKILREQEREIIFGLSNALGELERTSSLLQINSRRLDASKRQYQTIQEEFKVNDSTTIDLVLESQRRVIDAKLDFFRAQVGFMLAVKSVHFEKGTELQYHNVTLTESGWRNNEHEQAVNREKYKSRPINYYCPGLKVSSPLNQPQLSFGSPEAVETAIHQHARTKLNTQLVKKSPPSSDAEDSAAPLTTAMEKAATEPTDDGVLAVLAKKIKEADGNSNGSDQKSKTVPFFAKPFSIDDSAGKTFTQSSPQWANSAVSRQAMPANNSQRSLTPSFNRSAPANRAPNVSPISPPTTPLQSHFPVIEHLSSENAIKQPRLASNGAVQQTDRNAEQTFFRSTVGTPSNEGIYSSRLDSQAAGPTIQQGVFNSNLSPPTVTTPIQQGVYRSSTSSPAAGLQKQQSLFISNSGLPPVTAPVSQRIYRSNENRPSVPWPVQNGINGIYQPH